MARCRVDPSVKREVVNGFSFPLGVYPVEAMEPKAGYSVEFEPADGDDEGGDWEEWPDRYMFDVVIAAERLEALCRAVMGMMPGRVYPILDVLGQDAFREVDPYIAYDLVGLDKVHDALRRYRGFFFEDGLVGWGCMVEEPFIYLFVDEHKIVTIRVQPELKERVEKLLKAFDLEQVEDPAGPDAVSHEHRTVLVSEEGRTDLLNVDEIVEHLRDEWRLTLNIDPEGNVDDEGKELGVTVWRCLVRCSAGPEDPPKYGEVVLAARCLREAEDLCLDAIDEMGDEATAGGGGAGGGAGGAGGEGAAGAEAEWNEAMVVQSDRVDEGQVAEICRALKIEAPKPPLEPGVLWKGWLE